MLFFLFETSYLSQFISPAFPRRKWPGGDKILPSAGMERSSRRSVASRLGMLWKGDKVMRTLFLQAPSFDGFDGGAGARYQTKREIASFWYPTWLAQPAALGPDSKPIDAPPRTK